MGAGGLLNRWGDQFSRPPAPVVNDISLNQNALPETVMLCLNSILHNIQILQFEHIQQLQEVREVGFRFP